jgi:transcriptional regulator with XRE-family HTH domain
MSNARTTDFGARLRRSREAAELTQEELASKAGLTAKAISALERGERKRPHPHTVRSLADALDLPDTEREAFVASAPKRIGMAFLPLRSPEVRRRCRPPRSSDEIWTWPRCYPCSRGTAPGSSP